MLENKHFHVGQVKHYYRSGFSHLKFVLKNSEIAKVKILNPQIYFLATSIDLAVSESEEIKKIMYPFIKSLNDIYGKSDLNKLISKHTAVHDQHYKLWFSNTHVLQKLLNSNLAYRSVEFSEKHIQKRIALYVETEAFLQAREFLRDNKYIVITGDPGVGKTTLAEMLTYEYIKEDYELIYVYDSIAEADSALISDNKKQIIYFDDFLGSNAVEINKARGSDAFLNKILRRVKNLENKLLIFTTRKHILTRAVQESEKLKSFQLLAKEKILHLDNYTPDIKIQLLLNHIEYSDLDDKYKSVLTDPKVFNFIVSHEYFSPRSVEYIVSAEVVGVLSEEKYINFIKESFDHPSEIWAFAYSNQLNEDDRLLLNTLLSFGAQVEYSELERAFENRMKYEIENNNRIRSMYAFKNAFIRLLGSFIYSNDENYIRFINHSLLDFLLKYIQGDKIEVEKIVNSVVSVQQLTDRLFPLSGPTSHQMPNYLINRIIASYDSFIKDPKDDSELLKFALLINKYISSNSSDEIVAAILMSIDDFAQFYNDFELSDAFDEFLERTKNNKEIKEIISENIEELINDMVLSEKEFIRAFDKLNNLIIKFKVDIKETNIAALNKHFEDILHEELENQVGMLLEFIYSEDEIEDLRTEINSKISQLDNIGLSPKINFSIMDGFNWGEKVLDHYIYDQMKEED